MHEVLPTALAERPCEAMSRGRTSFPKHLLPPSAFPKYAPRQFFRHEILHQSKRSRARVGRIHTPHGTIDTPGFVVVGTNGAVKFVDHIAADNAGMQLMFSNTLHLIVHPGAEAIGAAGGLHKLMGRNKPLITDSGGFQIFSFANRGDLALPGRGDEASSSSSDELRVGSDDADLKSAAPEGRRNKYLNSGGHSTEVTISEAGATFRSYRDGSKIFLSPESTVEAQKLIGADIIIPLDDLPSAGVGGKTLSDAVERTHRWEARSLMAHCEQVNNQAMYCVLHGGTDYALRKHSLATLQEYPFDGYAIGGSFGRDKAEMLQLLEFLLPLIPTDKPNHLLGVGDLESIEAGVRLGVDTFDSSFPTRMGRHGTLLTRQGRIKIGQTRYRDDYGPIDEACDGFVSTHYTRAYLHHLWRANEPVVHGLCTLHNIKFMMDRMASIREGILSGEI